MSSEWKVYDMVLWKRNFIENLSGVTEKEKYLLAFEKCLVSSSREPIEAASRITEP